MKLSPQTLERHRATHQQPELPAMPPPTTVNASRDLGYNAAPPCKRCQVECDYCKDFMADHKAS